MTQAPNFTRGSWTVVKPHRGPLQVDGPGCTICHGIAWTPDASLIAAAPDIYDALTGLMDAIAHHFGGEEEGESWCRDWYTKGHAALDKAEGRQP